MSVLNEKVSLRQARETGDLEVAAGRANTQMGWYQLATTFVSGHEVLDVGCGLGDGLKTLAVSARSVIGQELDPRLKRSDILIQPLETIADESYDTVTSVEVIEHVHDPANFVQHLFRIARRQVFLTTPNWTASRCQWPYHIREFTPRELVQIMAPFGSIVLFKGTPSGHRLYKVKFFEPYFILNDLMSWKSSDWLMKYVHKLLPPAWKIGSNIAILAQKRLLNKQ